jgi:ribose/xylose/arabinose/galactoside ABC-type transport system permease subunit
MTEQYNGAEIYNTKKAKKQFEIRGFVLFGVLLLLIALFSFLAPNFLKLNNFMNLGMYSATMAISAAGMTFVIITGGIDISVGAIMSVSGVFAAYLLLVTSNVGIAVVGALLLGALIGFINGLLVTKLQVNSIIVTIGTMSILKGTVYLISGGRMVQYKNVAAFDYFGPARIGKIIPMALIIMVIVYVVFGFILSRLKFGRHVFATGGNKQSALLAGVKVNLITIFVFMISGLTAALSGIVLTSLLGAGMPQIGLGNEINVIAATILGGAAISGGRGNLSGTLVGVLIIEVVGNALTQLGLITFWQEIFKGVILILAVYFDQLREMRAAR